MSFPWDKTSETHFNFMLGKIPVFLREFAKNKVGKKAELNAQNNNHIAVTEKDLVEAFFSETPFGFHGPMKADMEEAGIDYIKYGFDK